jgi:hypothetical protein
MGSAEFRRRLRDAAENAITDGERSLGEDVAAVVKAVEPLIRADERTFERRKERILVLNRRETEEIVKWLTEVRSGSLVFPVECRLSIDAVEGGGIMLRMRGVSEPGDRP